MAQQKRGIDRKILFIKRLGGKCKCGYNKNYAAMTFHHLDPSQKEITLDIRSMSNNSIDRLEKEVAKCELLCHNCHMEIEHPNLDTGGPSQQSSCEPIVYETIALTKG